MEASKSNLSAAYKAARRTDTSSLETLCEYWRSNLVDFAVDGNNYKIKLLHFIAVYGNADAIKKLRDEKLLTTEQLIEMCDVHHDTALHVAARFGHLKVVKEILNGEENSGSLISAVNKSGDTPIYVAAAYGEIKVFDFLRKKVPQKDVTEMKREDGRTILHVAVEGQFFELASRILETYPELGDRPNKEGFTPLYLLACHKTNFRSGTMYNLKNLSSSPFIPWRIVTIIFYFLCFTPSHVKNSKSSTILAGYRRVLKAIPFFEEACKAREKHVYAYALARNLIKAQQKWPPHEPYEDSSSDPPIKEVRKSIHEPYEDSSSDLPIKEVRKIVHEPYEDSFSDPPINKVRKKVPDPLIEAVRNSIMELVKLILNKFPEAATAVDENERNILLVAAEMKHVFMYEYLKRKVGDEKKMLSEVDRHGNTALHLAADRSEFSKITFSPLLGMAWGVFWYQHVKLDMQSPVIRRKNADGLTAKEIFKKTHIRDPKSKETMIIKEAEEDAKKTNAGLMLVSVLIGTINFAAIFTVPGGFSQVSGIPLFAEQYSNKKTELNYFLLYIGVSLLSSLIALGTQLSIHLSRFRKVDFYFILPSKLFIATTALHYAATFSITACFQAYILEGALEDKVLENKVFDGMAVACMFAALVYFDLVYYIMNYLSFPIWYKFLAVPRKVIYSFFSKWWKA